MSTALPSSSRATISSICARAVAARACGLARFIAAKGSVALDGVSLTVNKVEGDTFSVLDHPAHLKVTTLGSLRIGARLNLEVDQMARYAARLLEPCYAR